MAQKALLDIFMESQEKQNQQHLVKAFHKIFSSSSFDEFWHLFEKLLLHPLAVYTREPSVEKVIDFIAKAATHLELESQKANLKNKNVGSENEEDIDEEDEIMHPFLMKLFEFLLDIHRSQEKAVRFRVCQLISKLLTNLGAQAQIDDDLYDRIYQCMIERLRDKCPLVRVHAVLALSRLQTPLDETCPITKAYVIMMSRDSNFEVRRIVLTCIASSKITLPAIIERTFDVKDKVRKTAYTVIAETIPVKALTIEQRVQLLQNGLNDRSEFVKAACSKQLLQSWLCACGGNVLELLALLDVQGSVTTCETAVNILFKSSSILDLIQKFDILNDKALINREKLSCESAFYWRSLLQYIYAAGHQFEEQLDQVRPNCLEFCAYVKSFADDLSKHSDVDELLDLQFILQQLLQMVTIMDLSDQASRRETEKLLHDLLISSSVGPLLISPILQSLKLVHGDTENFIKYIAETVSEIREPITTIETQISGEERRNLDKKIASIRVKLHQLREELSFCIEKQEFEKAAQLKHDISTLDGERSSLLGETEIKVEEIRTQKNDYFTVLKCLTIVNEILTTSNLKSFSPALQALMDSQILPGMTSVEAEIRNAAVKAISLCCLVTKDIVMRHLPVLMQASQMDSLEVRATALKAIFDIFHVYGPSAFMDSSEPSGDTSSDSVINDTVDQDEAETSTGQAKSATETSRTEGGNGNWSESASKIIALLSSYLDNESSDIRYIAAEGLCKLLLVGRIVSSKLLSHLLLLWYNPLIEDDTALIQILGTFFTMFAFSSSANQEVVEEAFIPTLHTVLHAPHTSPLSEINEINLSNFLVEIMDSANLVRNQNRPGIDSDNPCHDSLAVKLCNKILSDPDSVDNRLWLHTLNQLSISPDNITLIKNLFAMADDMLVDLHDKPCLKQLTKFKAMLKLLMESKTGDSNECTSEEMRNTLTNDVFTAESTNDAFENPNLTSSAVPKSTRKSKKSTKTPSLKKTATSNIQSDLADCVFTPKALRSSVAAGEMEATRINFENLCLDRAKTPGKTPKRPLYSLQDPKYTEASPFSENVN